jgi:hypothetical protein
MYVKVLISHDAGQAAMLRLELERAGLHPLELQTSPHVFTAGVDHGFYVEVPKDEAAEARNWLRENGYANLIVGS